MVEAAEEQAEIRAKETGMSRHSDHPVKVLLVTNMYPTPATPTAGPFVASQVESLRALGLKMEVMHFPRSQLGRRVYRGLAEKVGKAVVEFEPDVVHVSYGGIMAETVTRSVRDRPVLVTFHGTDLLAGPGESLLGGVFVRLGAMASRRAARRAAGVIVVSQNLFDALPTSMDRTRVWVVPNGIDLNEFRPRSKGDCHRHLGWDSERRHILFPSSPSRMVKRFSLAQASFEALRRHEPDAELHALENVPPKEVPIWLNAADAVLLTSAHEGSPVVVKEALACNVAVVSVDVGDVRERLEGVDGCFVVEPDPVALADALALTLARQEPIEGRGRVADLALERVAERVKDIYASVLAETIGTDERD
jgi:glycosyltransferase involved in cell wall biosynthesis